MLLGPDGKSPAAVPPLLDLGGSVEAIREILKTSTWGPAQKFRLTWFGMCPGTGTLRQKKNPGDSNTQPGLRTMAPAGCVRHPDTRKAPFSPRQSWPFGGGVRRCFRSSQQRSQACSTCCPLGNSPTQQLVPGFLPRPCWAKLVSYLRVGAVTPRPTPGAGSGALLGTPACLQPSFRLSWPAPCRVAALSLKSRPPPAEQPALCLCHSPWCCQEDSACSSEPIVFWTPAPGLLLIRGYQGHPRPSPSLQVLACSVLPHRSLTFLSLSKPNLASQALGQCHLLQAARCSRWTVLRQ